MGEPCDFCHCGDNKENGKVCDRFGEEYGTKKKYYIGKFHDGCFDKHERKWQNRRINHHVSDDYKSDFFNQPGCRLRQGGFR